MLIKQLVAQVDALPTIRPDPHQSPVVAMGLSRTDAEVFGDGPVRQPVHAKREHRMLPLRDGGLVVPARPKRLSTSPGGGSPSAHDISISAVLAQ